ncbi:hypothetical protein GH714_003547 [Hevea brasiliensis]|uniref:FMP27/BLTP2/Hobbit GFWDK motif-containing RBG unit domain-containing protein n=1 Tax=Hevea brasiliensis TaxID=3981 RepID=A0A6A6LJJ9_HEVBR|nr:hypothetical protein GH714_003547 [Hevea brasiliensis]
MAASPVKFLFGFLMVSITLWMVFIFASRLLAWILSRIVGASVGFRVGGWKCLRDVVVKFKKGAVESVSVGEIRLSVRQSLVKLGVGFFSRDPKLQVLICDLEIVMRSSSRGSQKTKAQKARTRNSGRGKWMVLANIARFLSVSVTDLVVKSPKAMIEIKELRLDITKDGGSKPNLFVKLRILPIIIHMGEPRVSCDQSSNYDGGGCISVGETSFGITEGPFASFICEDFLSLVNLVMIDEGVGFINFTFLYLFLFGCREVGVIIRNLDITCGEVIVHLNEKLLSKNRTLDASTQTDKAVVNSAVVKDPQRKQSVLVAIIKYTSMFPQKVSFTLPKLDVRFVHREHDLVIENNIMGIQLKSIKSLCTEDMGESTRLDVQMDFSEIHLLREAGTSVMEILKVVVISFVYIPIEPTSPVRAEIDVRLGGTQCNIIMSRLKPWLQLHYSRKKKMVLREEIHVPVKSQSTASKAIMWTCTVSAPEMTIVLYSINGLPLYHLCSQSSHVFANNVSSMGTAIHLELGELNFHMSDEYQECLKESPFVVESNSGALVHIARVSLDWGKKDIESSEEDGARCKLVLSVDVTGKGIQVLKFNLERCTVNFCGETSLDNAVVADPKRVNYGSQGGRVVISVSDDGTPRTASVISTVSDDCKKLKYSLSLDIFHYALCVIKENQTTEMELERARSIYQEHLEKHRSDTKVTLFDVQNAKFVRRSGGLKGIAICSLFSATEITVRWEPDAHLSLIELVLQLKLLVHNQKLQEHGNERTEEASSMRDTEQKKDASLESGNFDKPKKKENIFAVDVEMLSVSAGVGDGVDAMVHVQSIFSENARIGVLLEGLILSFNGAKVFRSGRMQISRIPSTSSSSSNAKLPSAITWDWVIQGLDVHIRMPYRLELRAIDDSVEDMLRALKLVTAAKTQLIFPMKKESSKSKKSSSTKFGCVKFCIRKLIADIEEEPMQGWLDEHYQLMKSDACELAVRQKFLDEFISKVNNCSKTAETNDSTIERKIILPGMPEVSTFEGSGACREGFQSGFKPSTSRTSLLSISATELDVSLTRIDGGDDGMIEVLKKLDPVCREVDIPFSRLYGSNILLHTGTLVAQIRNYTFPLFAGAAGKCEGRVVLAQQATCFQPQIYQDVFIGRWRKVRLLRSATGTTPPTKSYFDLPMYFQKAEVSFGVGYEPSFADVSYAFTVALRRANLSVRNPGPLVQPPKKERSLPWWDDMRNYIHGNITLGFSETRWHILATTDPYEKLDKLQITSGSMEIQQSDGRIYMSAKDFKIFLSSLERLASNCGLKLPSGAYGAFLEAPVFILEVTMDWDCDSGTPLNHYLFALPNEGRPREKVFDPFRSTSLLLRWNFSLRPSISLCENQSSSSSMGDSTVVDGTVYNPPHKPENVSIVPTLNVGAHDFAWLKKFWNLNYLPPHKLRYFSRWPRFGVPRIPRSGNLSLDRVMTEFFLRVDATPACIKHMPLDDDDPAKGLTFNMTKLKYEICFSRGKQKYTFECKRDTLDLVYQGVDLHMPKAILDKEDSTTVAKVVQMTKKNCQPSTMGRIPSEKHNNISGCTEKHRDDGFLLSCDYFTIRRQAPKADPTRLLAWQEAGRKNLEMTYVRSEFENGSESDDHTRSDPGDDDGYNVVIADNCQRVFVYSLKLLWNIENRDAVWSWVGGLSKAFAPPKPSPSRQYAQRKLLEENQSHAESEVNQDDISKPPSTSHNADSPSQHAETSGSLSSPSHSAKIENSSSAVATNGSIDDSEEEGTRHFMVNVIEPQFNLHSEEANGRFLLAAVSGRVLARSFHSVLHVGYEMIEQALGSGDLHLPESVPEMTWKRMEFSVMLEHVQAHVAPTDVDPGAGLQWLPKIRRSSPKVKRTGALLERVFMPCDMYFRYTRHKGGTPDLKVKPLKELTFNTDNITATMTSRQFQVMLDVLTNLLFARLPKPRKSSLSFPAEDDEDVEEEADEMVPDGVEEVELAKIELERKEREQKLLLDDIRRLSLNGDTSGDLSRKEGELWMITGGRSNLVQGLKRELVNAKRFRKAASASLRMALQKAAQLRLMEKEKNKSPSYAMRISLKINKVVWNMLVDGKSFAEAEINDMIFDFDRDYKDVVLLYLQQNILLKVMLRVDAKQGAPRDGNSHIELFQVEIYPLKIHLTETMYRMMWEYFFPEEEQDSQRRQEVWKVSTTAGARRVKKGPELRRTSSFDRTWEETLAESVATELVLQVHSSSISTSKADPLGFNEQPYESSKSKSKESKLVKSGRSSHEGKKIGKSNEEKRSRPRKVMEFHNIKISQVELQITYESSRFNLHELKLLMDTFHRVEFTGTWRRLFSRVKKHVVWGTLKSVTGMQGKKFKDKAHNQRESNGAGVPDIELNFSDNDGQPSKSDQYPNWLKRPSDGAGDGFVTSIRGLFNTQRRKARAFVLRTMRGEAENDFHGEWSESDVEFSPFARQLTITKAKKLIRRHTKKFRSRGQKGSTSSQRDSLPSSPRETTPFEPFESDSSSESSPYEDFHEQLEFQSLKGDL